MTEQTSPELASLAGKLLKALTEQECYDDVNDDWVLYVCVPKGGPGKWKDNIREYRGPGLITVKQFKALLGSVLTQAPDKPKRVKKA